MRTIKLSEKAFDKLPQKKTTIRHGRKDYQLGEAIFESVDTKRKAGILILRVEYCKFGNIYESDIKDDGFNDWYDAFMELSEYYPTMQWNDEYTVVKFSTVEVL